MMTTLEKVMVVVALCSLWYLIALNHFDLQTTAQHIVDTHTEINKRLEACEARHGQ